MATKTKNIDTMIRHLKKVQSEINNLADEKWEKYVDLPELDKISVRGNRLHTKFNRLYKALSVIDDAIRELELAKKCDRNY